MSAFAKDPQYAEALGHQGTTRNNITLPAASGALGLPMLGAAAPGAGSALAAGANQLSQRAMCSVSVSVAMVSPSTAITASNPGVQGAVLDAIEGFFVPGPPPQSAEGVLGWFTSEMLP